MPLPEVKYARTDTLEIAYEDSGPTDAETIFLLHGFPYDPRAYDAMVPRLDIPGSVVPAAPEQEYRFWYQYYFHTERGRAGLAKNRREFCRLLWRLWSPHWEFDAATFERSAKSFDNSDFVDVVIQSYRHRYGYAAGDPALESIEQQLIAQPAITVPTIVLHGEADGIQPAANSLRHAPKFTGFYERRTVARAGHNLPQEVPEFVCKATLDLLAQS